MSARSALGTVALAVTASLLPAAPANADSGIILGANGAREELSRRIGAPLADHAYGKLDGPVRLGTLVNIESRVHWRTVAGAAGGSGTYSDIVRWAQGVKAAGRPVMVSFHHEPEAKENKRFGDPKDFVAAWRRVADVFRAQGANNVEWVWNMTAYAFKADDGRAAAQWYPGDSYVDDVGADPYNWYHCGPGNGEWRSLSEIMAPVLSFARARGKKVVLPEFATTEFGPDPGRKAAWVRDAHQFFVANRNTMRAVFYYQSKRRVDCDWILDRPAEIEAFARMARDPAFRSR